MSCRDRISREEEWPMLCRSFKECNVLPFRYSIFKLFKHFQKSPPGSLDILNSRKVTNQFIIIRAR